MSRTATQFLVRAALRVMWPDYKDIGGGGGMNLSWNVHPPHARIAINKFDLKVGGEVQRRM